MINWLSRSIRHRALLIVVVPLLFATSLVAALRLMLEDSRKQASAYERSRAVIECANDLARTAFETGTALYVHSIGHNSETETRFIEAVNELRTNASKLRTLVGASSEAEPLVNKMERLISRAIALLEQAKQTVDAGDRLSSLSELGDTRLELQSILRKLVNASSQLQQMERSKLPTHSFDEKKFNKLFDAVLFSGLGLNAAIAIFMSMFFTRSITNRLDILTDNAKRFSRKEELNASIGGSDELTLLDNTFHTMTKEVREAEKLKQSFIAIVGHELRSPLQVIKTSLNALQKGHYGVLSTDGTQSIVRAERNVARLMTLVNEILDAEKLESGKIAIEPVPADLHEIVENVVLSMRAVADEKQMDIEICCPPSVPVEVDTDRIEQVLINLLANAVKFSPPATKVSVTVLDLETSVKVEVKDQGPGIPQEHLHSVFEKFFQVPDKESTETGTGLGLAIARAILTGHGGEIGVESEVNKGSVFWFSLPRDLG